MARLILPLAHGDDVVEPDLHRAAVTVELHEFGAVGGVDVGDPPVLTLRDAFELELQLDARLVQRRRFELIVIVAGNRLVTLIRHESLLRSRLTRTMPKKSDECRVMSPIGRFHSSLMTPSL